LGQDCAWITQTRTWYHTHDQVASPGVIWPEWVMFLDLPNISAGIASEHGRALFISIG
jgi:hypothetical protein